MSKPKAPQAPDPKETAAAQTGTNVSTALANAYLGNVNQVTPEGSLIYNKTGSYQMRDPYTGQTYDIPTFTATQTYSPVQTAINDQSNAAQLNLASLANSQSGFLNKYFSEPVDLSNDAAEARLMQLGRERLDPLLADRQQNLETSLANRGVKMGSTAYDRAMTLNSQSDNDAYNQLLINGHGQAMQDLLQQRNQPLNEITALLSNSQVTQPNYQPISMPTIANTDVSGIIQNNFQNQMAQYNQKSQAAGGLFQAGGAILGAAMMSDRRIKKDVTQLGHAANGLPLYSFRFVNEPDEAPLRFGLMAQDVMQVMPDAVMTQPNGYLSVDYAKALA